MLHRGGADVNHRAMTPILTNGVPELTARSYGASDVEVKERPDAVEQGTGWQRRRSDAGGDGTFDQGLAAARRDFERVRHVRLLGEQRSDVDLAQLEHGAGVSAVTAAACGSPVSIPISPI